MKKILAFGAFFLSSFVFSFDAKLSVEPTKTDINNPVKLILEIENDENQNISIKEIKNLDKFDIIWQNQFQSFSSQIQIINWKQVIKQISKQTLILILQAKKAGKYTIWPAILEVWNKIYKTNSVNVEITWVKIMIWNTPSYSQNNQNNTNPTNTTKQPLNNQNYPDENLQENNQNNTNYLFIMLLVLLIVIWFLIIFYVFKNFQENKQENKQENTFQANEETNLNTQNLLENHPLAFLEKYWIEKPQTKTYTEIIKELEEKNINLSETEKNILKKELLDKFIP